MTLPSPAEIRRQYYYLAPAFVISIVPKGSKDIPVTQRIDSFEFTDSEDQLDYLKVVVADNAMELIDSPDIQEDKQTLVRFKWGYPGWMTTERTALISGLEPSFPNNGPITLTIEAFDEATKLTQEVVQKIWEREEMYTESDIVQEIAKNRGMESKVEPTKNKERRWTQCSLTDFEFIQELTKSAKAANPAKMGAYKFYVENNVVHFHPSNMDTPPIATYTYYTDGRSLSKQAGKMLSFRPQQRRQSKEGTGSEVSRKGVGVEAATTTTANKDKTARPTLGDKLSLDLDKRAIGAYMGEENVSGKIAHAPELLYNSEEKSQALADQEFKEADENVIEASLEVIGDPTLRAKRTIQVLGVGKKHSGLWYIKEVRHSIGPGGYICSLSLKRNAMNVGTTTVGAGVPNKAAVGEQMLQLDLDKGTEEVVVP